MMNTKKFIAFWVAFFTLATNVSYAATSSNNTKAPPASLYTNSWSKTSKSQLYRYDCKTSVKNVKKLSGLTEEQSQLADVLTAMVKAISSKSSTYFNSKQNKVRMDQSKSEVVEKFIGSKTGEEAVAAIQNPGKRTMTVLVDGSSFYYTAKGTGVDIPWTTFSEESKASVFLDSVRQNAITSGLNQYSFQFTKWKPGTIRQAIYSGSMTTDSSKSTVEGVFGKDETLTANLKPGKATIYVNERTGEWSRANSSVSLAVDAWGISFDIAQSCTFKWKASQVKINPPKKAATAEDALTELQKMADLMVNF